MRFVCYNSTCFYEKGIKLIGIIGYGMVGKAVANGFSKTDKLISDPKYNDLSIEYMVSKNPEAIFVCVPTPTDGTDYKILRDAIDTINANKYTGLVVVKSTVLPYVLEQYDVVYNPEFLSRATANEDFVNPPMVILGGKRAIDLLALYKKYSDVDTSKTFITDVKTACLTKYIMNSFYATKVTFMNQMYDVSTELGVDFAEVGNILSQHPWMGTHHFQVPGPDGERGFGGPCLPKDTEALAGAYDVELLNTVLELNRKYRT